MFNKGKHFSGLKKGRGGRGARFNYTRGWKIIHQDDCSINELNRGMRSKKRREKCIYFFQNARATLFVHSRNYNRLKNCVYFQRRILIDNEKENQLSWNDRLQN